MAEENLSDAGAPQSFREQRIRALTKMYYSRPEIQNAIFEFSRNREICPRYFEGFGKRPDSFQYIGDIFELVKKGATSFHCSEELWSNPLNIQTGMSQEEYNKLRTGWDFIIDIDSKYLDYSKIMAKIIIHFLKFNGIKNIGIKFSGSKGFHLIIPWKALPKQINNLKTSDMFPEWARIITSYIMEKTKAQLIEKISELESPNKYIKNYQAPKEVMPDLILVSPRHLFRMPYSLHEKTALASVALSEKELEIFEPRHAESLNLPKNSVRNFTPDSNEGEASQLFLQALDWGTSKKISEPKIIREFKPLVLSNANISDADFPPCVNKVLRGVNDGKKRSVFILINFFRSLNLDKEDIEKRIYEWNKKNKEPLREGYIQTQLAWSYKRKPMMPPNCREFYANLGVCSPDNLCNLIKNPINYAIKKSLMQNNSQTKTTCKN